MYRIERSVGLTHVRLRAVLWDLSNLGMLNGGMQITGKGYEFLSDFSSKVIPTLQKYGLSEARL